MDRWGLLRRGLALSVFAGALVVPAPAQATRSTISVSSSPASPVGAQPFTLTVSGNNQGPSTDNVGVQISIAPAPHTCADQQGDDTGGYVLQFDNQIPTGSYSVSAQSTAQVHGTWVVCAWLLDATTGPPALAQQSMTLPISNPTSISLLLSPSPTYPGRLTAVSAQGNADEGIDVYVTSKPDASGAGCAPTPGQDGGALLYTDNGLGAGAWSDNGTDISNLKVGTLLLCGWVLVTGAPSGDASQVLARTNTRLSVLAPH